MARLPIVTQRRDIDVRVVFGQSIFELYQQIQILLQRETPDLSNFFAEPIVNAVRGEVTWNTRAVGVPRHAVDLSPEEWTQVNQRLKQTHKTIKQLVEKLEKAGRGDSAGTEALRGMLITPDLQKSLFLVGNELILTQWGCYEFGTDARSADLFEQIDRAPKFTSPPPPTASKPVKTPQPHSPPPNPAHPQENIPSTRAEGVNSPKEADPPESIPFTEPSVELLGEPMAEVAEHRTGHWRWLLLLLLLLLLLIGILWKLWEGHSSNSEVVLRAEVAELWQKVDKKARDCGLLPQAPAAANPSTQAPITNEEFRERQKENSIKPDSKVNVSLAWNNHSDLDLLVKQPDGQTVFFKPCASATCGTLDVDANYCSTQSSCSNLKDQPLENISWRGQIPKGRYEVFVGLYSTNRSPTESRSVDYTIQVTVDGQSNTYHGVFRSEDMKCDQTCTSGLRLISQFTVE